ncbi:MAG: hypothetical protein HYV07_15275 [Deltaproteobacteria bacterium]|nr:hypothetical protein [Deltaproteobacteria bacterium]
MTFEGSRFYFATSQVGAERALKGEVARFGMSPAYSRPGLLTFKMKSCASFDFSPDLVFARSHGLSLGTAGAPKEVLEVWHRMGVPAFDELHVSPRDRATTAGGAWDRARELDEKLRAALGLGQRKPPVAGAIVGDVVIGGDEPIVVGVHRHTAGRSPHPGGAFIRELPAGAPSRAYMKLVEALEWSGLEVRPGGWALEVGASPGGAVLALLERGSRVCAVDPRRMNEALLSRPELTHLQKRIEQVRRSELPEHVELLTVDMGLSPRFAMHHVERLASWFRRSLRGLIVTLKLKEWSFVADLPEFAERTSAMGFEDVRIRQLAWNRQEVCLMARRPLAQFSIE